MKSTTKCVNARPDPVPYFHENKQFYLYFLMPFLFGVLLGDGLGIDVSSTAAQYIGLLGFIQTSGIDIHTKSIILILYLVFAPCYWHYFFKRRNTNPPSSYQLKTASVSRTLALILGLLVAALVFGAIIFIGPHKDALITPDRQIRLLLACSKWNISFAAYIGLIVWGGTLAVYAPFVLTNELLLRLKNRITNSTGRSK